MYKQFIRNKILVLAVLSVLTLTACNNLVLPWNNPEEFCKDKLWCANSEFVNQQDAMRIHIAPISIDRWENFINTLQPTFPVTPNSALALALPKTSFSQNNLSEVFSAALQLGLPQSTLTNTVTQALSNSSTSSVSNGGKPISSSQSSDSSTNNSSSSVLPGSAPASSLTAPSMPDAASLTAPTGTLQYDPILTYKTATTIYQEIQLLNNYVKKAALQNGAIPYLVRLQVAIQPNARNEPYDVYIELGLTGKYSIKEEKNEKTKINPVRYPLEKNLPATIIPLLVTDNVEVDQASAAKKAASQLALSLGGIVNNLAAQGQTSDLSSNFNAIFGSDLNSLFTVSRSSENTLLVRIGANRVPSLSSDPVYSTEAQTHDVSFIALVPSQENQIKKNKNYNGYLLDDNLDFGYYDPQSLYVNSSSKLVNALTGNVVNYNEDAVHEKIDDLVDKYADKLKPSSKGDCKTYLTDLAESIRISKEEIIEASVNTNNTNECLFFGTKKQTFLRNLNNILSYSKYQNAIFSLPDRFDVDEYLSAGTSQPVILIDDGKNTTVTIGGLNLIEPTRFVQLLAKINFLDTDNNSVIKYVVPSTLTVIPPLSSGTVSFQFNSLQDLFKLDDNLLPSTTKQCDTKDTKKCRQKDDFSLINTATITINENLDNRYLIDNDNPDDKVTYNNIFYKKKLPSTDNTTTLGAPATKTTITALPKILLTDSTGTGKVRVQVQTDQSYSDIELKLDGANLAATPTIVVPTVPVLGGAVSTVTLSQDASIIVSPADKSTPLALDLSLQGLTPGSEVKFTIRGRKPDPVTGKLKAEDNSTATVSVTVKQVVNTKVVKEVSRAE